MGIDLHSVKQFILQKTISDDLLNPEEEKLIDSLNRLVLKSFSKILNNYIIICVQEVVKKEIETTEQQKNNIKLEVDQSVADGEKLQQLYQKRDQILGLLYFTVYAIE